MISGALGGKYAVVGVGTTTFGLLPGEGADDLGAWALKEALADAAVDASAVDGLIVNRVSDYQRLGEWFGIDPSFIAQLPAQGRMSGGSIGVALGALEAGLCTCVALVYGNSGKSDGATYGGVGKSAAVGEAAWRRPYGMTSPGAFHALMFRRHMEQFGTLSRDLAEVAVTFRDHARLNPNAVMRSEITIEDHQQSRYVAEPLRLFDYCIINDGGVALIITSRDRAMDLAKPPAIIYGYSQASKLVNVSMPPEDYWYEPCRLAAKAVYDMSGLGRTDLDGLQIYDNFTPTVLFTLEGFGFCGRGEAGPWIRDGRLSLAGEYPTNTSGGHLSESYMQGWALNVEAVRQVRGECGERQIPDAKFTQYMAATPVVTSVIYGRLR